MNWAMAMPEKAKPGPKHEDTGGYTCVTSLERRKKMFYKLVLAQ